MRQSQQTTTMVPTSTLLVLFALAPSSCAHQFTTRPHLSSSLRPAVSLSARAPPIQALALPVVTPDGILPLALCSGAIGLAAQLGLTGLFRASKDPVLSGAPGYTAHQVVAFFLMAFVAALGLVGWLNPPAVAATAAGRLLAPSNSARWLGAMLLGMLVAWDIPTSIAIPRLRKPDVLTHHIAMAAVAFVGAFFLPTRYGFYYMGVAELSSIPLTAYDLFERSAEVAGVESASSGTDMDKARAKRLRSIRDACRAVAAVAFVVVRAFDFTRVTLTRFVPDALSVLGSAATAASFRLPIQFMLVSSVGFVGLQLYWFSLFIRISRAQSAREKRKAQRESRKAAASE